MERGPGSPDAVKAVNAGERRKSILANSMRILRASFSRAKKRDYTDEIAAMAPRCTPLRRVWTPLHFRSVPHVCLVVP